MEHAQARELLMSLLGISPAEAPVARLVSRQESEHYTLERLVLEGPNGGIPALFTLPRRGKPPYPAVLFNHSHGGFYELGKREFAHGNVYLVSPPYAQALAERGFAALCIDQLNFGERHGKSESHLFKELLWRGQVMWGLMVQESLSALAYLEQRSEVDARRLATLGISMGSTMSWWLGALDERVRVVVELCCLTDYHELIASGGVDHHSLYYYVPGLLRHFTSAEILTLIAPRPLLSLAGNQDPLTPARGLDRLGAALEQAYAAAGASEAFRMIREEHGHFETHAMRAAALAWLERWL